MIQTFEGEVTEVTEQGDHWVATYTFKKGTELLAVVKEFLPKFLWPEVVEGMKVAYSAFTPHSTTRSNFTLGGRSASY